MTPAPRSGHFFLLAGAVVAVTVYGSLVPFEYVPRSWENAKTAFEWVLKNRTHLESKSDGLANLILGLPLGFCFLAGFRVDKVGLGGSFITAALLLPLCIVFAAGVEFAQLWFPKRTCSATDIMAQSLGSALGMLFWIVAGQKLVVFIRGTWASDKLGGKPIRVLFGYLLLLFIIQVLPFDVSTSPKEIAGRVWHKQNVTLAPFAEWQNTANNANLRSEKITAWLKALVLFGTVGALLPAWRTLKVLWVAVMVATAAELVQIPVWSRSPSTTDVILGIVAIVFVWLHKVAMAEMSLATRAGLGFVVVVSTMALANWWPLDFDSHGPQRLTHLNAVPFASVETQHYLFLLEQVMETLAIWGIAGAAVVLCKANRTPKVATLIVTVCALAVEIGQVWLPSRTPATTDVILAALGAYFGAVIGNNVWANGNKETNA